MQFHLSAPPQKPSFNALISFPSGVSPLCLEGSHISSVGPLDFPLRGALFKDVQLPHREPGWPPWRPVVSPSVAGFAWVDPCAAEVLAGISALIPAITLPVGVIRSQRILLQITVKWTPALILARTTPIRAAMRPSDPPSDPPLLSIRTLLLKACNLLVVIYDLWFFLSCILEIYWSVWMGSSIVFWLKLLPFIIIVTL